jgi:hypothetical protein
MKDVLELTKGNILLRTEQEVQESDQVYSCTLSLTTTLQVLKNPPRKIYHRERDMFPFFQKGGGTQFRLGRCEKSPPNRD